MFSQSREKYLIWCLQRELTRIDSGQSVDVSLETDLNWLDLSTGLQEIHSDLVATQDQLCVALQEQADYSQQRNAVIDQHNQSKDDADVCSMHI